ncbi:hypothetical protein NDU88_001401 [Pleurodeles waltl]|uniref:Uncharacterized protein n=1 Tax=Pleurodeles waltl TaxID=8319 RepID=A0AAV7M313_PLEWA|nr:hypothetical protein NDU88_001401 [Pleurodeles waltl]
MDRTACSHKHPHNNANGRQEEKADAGETERCADQECEQDAGGERDTSIRQEEEADAGETKGDADQEYGGDAGGECDAKVKQDEGMDGLLETEDTGQEREEDTEGASQSDKLHSSRIKDPETHHVPGGTWLAQVRAQLQGSASALLKKENGSRGDTEELKGDSHSLDKKGAVRELKKNSLGHMMAGAPEQLHSG